MQKSIISVLGFCVLFAGCTQAQYDPCSAFPAPCGPNSQCSVVGGQVSCACLDNFIGYPPICRRECGVASECRAGLACINYRCVAGCPGVCGRNSECQIVNHTPECVCLDGFTGNPHADCVPVSDNSYPAFFLIPPQ